MTSRRRWLARRAALAVFAVAFITLPRPSRAQETHDGWVTSSELAFACKVAMRQSSTPFNYPKLRNFCRLEVARVLTPEKQWSWTIARIPAAKAVEFYPSLVEQNDVAGFRGVETNPSDSTRPIPLMNVNEESPLTQLSTRAFREGAGEFHAKSLSTAAPLLLTGGLESALLWSVADLLFDRAKEELDLAALGQVRRVLCGDKSKVKRLLEKTCTLVPGDSKGDWSLPGIVTLRAAVESDVRGAPVKALRFAADSIAGVASTDASYTLGMLLEVSASIAAGDTPADAIRALAYRLPPTTTIALTRAEQPVAASLSDLSWLLASVDLRSALSVSTEWEDEVGRTVKAVALNASSSNAWPTSGPLDAPGDVLRINVPAIAGRLLSLQPIVSQLAQLHEVMAAVRRDVASESEQRRSATLARVASLLVQVAGEASANAQCTTKDGLACQAPVIMRVIASLGTRDYGDALIQAAAVLTQVAGTKNEMLSPNALRTLSVAADLASATNSDAVSNAVRRFAAPAHSWRAKRATDTGTWYGGLNGYVGASLGSEWANGEKSSFAGPWVPVGLEIGGRGRGASFGVFVPLIDVGALLTYRQKNENATVDTRPPATFRQVWNPGLYVVVGIPRSPLGLAAGYTYAPYGRELLDPASEQKVVRARQLRVALTLDIPLFP